MEHYVEKYGWKKVGAVLIIGSILVLLFCFYSFANIDRQANEDAKRRIEQLKNSN